jgi:hypothetical protein
VHSRSRKKRSWETMTQQPAKSRSASSRERICGWEMHREMQGDAPYVGGGADEGSKGGGRGDGGEMRGRDVGGEMRGEARLEDGATWPPGLRDSISPRRIADEEIHYVLLRLVNDVAARGIAPASVAP